MIQATKLTRQFDKRGIAGLHDLSFSLKKGQIMSIMGPNGSGKTTLLKILSGEIKQDSGDFEAIGGISSFPQHESLENINVQTLLINSVTLNVDIEKKIQLARDLANTFEFTFQLRQNFHELSSGQRQKILLAKELINRPALLLMDEPFSHLDPFTRRDILNDLFQYIRQQEITVLWVTHDLPEAFLYSDLIGLMQFGKFEQLDNPENMARRPRSLFAAKFMGYRNFFPSKAEGGTDAILIVPDRAWELNAKGTSYRVVKRFAGVQSTEYILSDDTKSVHLVRGPQLSLFEVDSRISISPIMPECFSIPL